MSANNGKPVPRKIVSGLPLMKQAGEVLEIARDLFMLVGSGISNISDVLEEIRAEDIRHHKALERHFNITPEGEELDVDDDELAEELAH